MEGAHRLQIGQSGALKVQCVRWLRIGETNHEYYSIVLIFHSNKISCCHFPVQEFEFLK